LPSLEIKFEISKAEQDFTYGHLLRQILLQRMHIPQVVRGISSTYRFPSQGADPKEIFLVNLLTRFVSLTILVQWENGVQLSVKFYWLQELIL
jgi:hypothetical protein